MSTTTLPRPAVAGAPGPAPASGYLTDVGTVFARELRPLLHEPFSLVFGMVQPLFFLALFGPLLISTTGLGDAATLQWFVPGILVMSTLFACSMTGSNLLFEVQSGAHERMLVTPLRRSSLIVGRALKEIVPVVGQAVLIVLAALPFGFDLHLAGALLGLVLIAVFGVGLGALSYALALAVRDQDWMFWMVQQTFLFPLMLLSGMLLPLDDGPGWLRGIAAANPLRYLVDGARSTFDGDLTSSAVAWAAVASFGVALAGLAIGVRTLRRVAG